MITIVTISTIIISIIVIVIVIWFYSFFLIIIIILTICSSPLLFLLFFIIVYFILILIIIIFIIFIRHHDKYYWLWLLEHSSVKSVRCFLYFFKVFRLMTSFMAWISTKSTLSLNFDKLSLLVIFVCVANSAFTLKISFNSLPYQSAPARRRFYSFLCTLNQTLCFPLDVFFTNTSTVLCEAEQHHFHNDSQFFFYSNQIMTVTIWQCYFERYGVGINYGILESG